jgi:pimeloyl-ACP methyl ester carboxylesterase
MRPEFDHEWRETRLPGGGVVRYLVTGAGDPLILLHGLSGSVDWWRRNLQEFASRFRVYAIDLIHHGNAARGRFVLSEAGDRLAGWMTAEGIGRAHLIGHSMGGHIATQIALSHPSMVRKLVLVNAAILSSETAMPEPSRVFRWLPTFPPALAPILLRDALRAGPTMLWEASRELMTSDLREKVQRLKAPTLIVWGTRDGLVPVELAHELHEELPGSKLCIVEGAGHNVMWEAPEVFNDTVLEFLKV